MVAVREVALHALRAVRAIRHDAVRPPWVAPGHYYSPRTSGADVQRAVTGRRVPVGIDLREADQLMLAAKLDLAAPPDNRYSQHAANTMFNLADATVYRGMLLHFRPKRIVEIGSGYSTAIALDVAETDLPDLRITCVEPFADRLRSRLRPGDEERLILLEQPVQDVDPMRIAVDIAADDILFIDSTHVVKAGSDVVHLMLHTLPLLQVGALVHIHDIQWPFEYPDDWLKQQRDWTETYLLHSFLLGNAQWRIELFADWLISQRPEVVPEEIRGMSAGSIWLRRIG